LHIFRYSEKQTCILSVILKNKQNEKPENMLFVRVKFGIVAAVSSNN